jgi:hypothetical protein
VVAESVTEWVEAMQATMASNKTSKESMVVGKEGRTKSDSNERDLSTLCDDAHAGDSYLWKNRFFQKSTFIKLGKPSAQYLD